MTSCVFVRPRSLRQPGRKHACQGAQPPWTPIRLRDEARYMNEKTKPKRSGSDNRKRHPRVYSRVSDDEHAQIDMDATALGLSISGYIRWLAVNRPQTRAVRRPLADVTLLKQLKGQCGRIGGNLHQLLKLANRGEIPWSDELEAAAKEVRDFLATANAALKGVQ